MLQDGHYGDWPDISKRQVGYHELANYPKSFLNLFCYVSGSLKTQGNTMGGGILPSQQVMQYHLRPFIHIILQVRVNQPPCRRDFTHSWRNKGGKGVEGCIIKVRTIMPSTPYYYFII